MLWRPRQAAGGMRRSSVFACCTGFWKMDRLWEVLFLRTWLYLSTCFKCCHCQEGYKAKNVRKWNATIVSRTPQWIQLNWVLSAAKASAYTVSIRYLWVSDSSHVCSTKGKILSTDVLLRLWLQATLSVLTEKCDKFLHVCSNYGQLFNISFPWIAWNKQLFPLERKAAATCDGVVCCREENKKLLVAKLCIGLTHTCTHTCTYIRQRAWSPGGSSLQGRSISYGQLTMALRGNCLTSTVKSGAATEWDELRIRGMRR